MNRMNKKAWGLVAVCVLLVAAILVLPALWMIRQQDAHIGQVTYLPDYTTVALGEKAAANPVARSLYEHKQTFLIQGDEYQWNEIEQWDSTAVFWWQLAQLLGDQCPTIQQALLWLGLDQLTYEDTNVIQTGTKLGFDLLEMNRVLRADDSNESLVQEYWMLQSSYNSDLEKILSLELGYYQETRYSESQLEEVQEEPFSQNQEAQEAAAAMAQEYLAYLNLESSSFQQVNLSLDSWQQELLDQDYCCCALYSAEYQVYVYASMGYAPNQHYALNLGVASLTPEELEKCLAMYG